MAASSLLFSQFVVFYKCSEIDVSIFIANQKIANSINDSVSVRSLCSCKIAKAILVLNSDIAFEYQKNYSNQSLANSFDLFQTLLFIFEKVGGYSPQPPCSAVPGVYTSKCVFLKVCMWFFRLVMKLSLFFDNLHTETPLGLS